MSKPIITIISSEHEDIKSNEKYTIAEIEEKLLKLDKEVIRLKKEADKKGEYYPFSIVSFQIDVPGMKDYKNNENSTYKCSYNIGTEFDGLINNINTSAKKFKLLHPIGSVEYDWVINNLVPRLKNEELIEKAFLKNQSHIEQLTAEGKLYSCASSYIKDVEHELKNWEKGLEEIQNGTFEYDDSMPKQCVDAMYEEKVKVCRAVLDYLYSLDKDTILSDNVSLTEAGSRFYEMINSSYEKLQEKGFIKDTRNTNEKIELNNEVEEEFEM